MPTIQELANFAATLTRDALPPPIARRLGAILADCVACIVAGNRMAEVRALSKLRAATPDGAATLLGAPLALPPESAAFINGMAGTWHDLDEGNIHTKGHAGIQITPALLAEAERRRAPGQDVLVALAAGYEVGCRVYGATAARLAVHPHGTFGPLAAAVALARLRGLPPDRMAQAIRLAAGLGVAASRATLAGGATIRNAYTGTSGAAAFLALDLEQSGLTGEADPLATVFGQIYGTSFDPALATADLGQTWRLMRNYFKLHPSARYAHSALDLVDDIAAAHGPIDPAQIAAIHMETYAFAATLAGQAPTTPFGTRFSIPVLVAARLLHAEEPLDGDGAPTFANPEIRALAQRVHVRENPAFTAAYPQQQPSRMTVTLVDGATLHAEVAFIRGEAERKHGAAALRAKFLTLTAPSWPQHAETAYTALTNLDALPDMAAWAAATRAAAA